MRRRKRQPNLALSGCLERRVPPSQPRVAADKPAATGSLRKLHDTRGNIIPHTRYPPNTPPKRPKKEGGRGPPQDPPKKAKKGPKRAKKGQKRAKKGQKRPILGHFWPFLQYLYTYPPFRPKVGKFDIGRSEFSNEFPSKMA